ncbi:MAG: cbb3-type cytochrome c oxidase subunit I [Caldilineaceae bacterium]
MPIVNVPAIVLIMSSMFWGWDGGWTLYPPLSIKGPLGYQFVIMGVFLLGFSVNSGSLNLIATMFFMRPKGMSLFRMPIFCWAILATSFIQLTATQFIAQSFLMLSMERLLAWVSLTPIRVAIHSSSISSGSIPIRPSTSLSCPGLGIISELLPVFSRKPLFGYRWIALSSIAIALVGHIVWGHHMFTSGYNPQLRYWFMFSTLLVAGADRCQVL